MERSSDAHRTQLARTHRLSGIDYGERGDEHGGLGRATFDPSEAARLMLRHKFGGLPVLDGGKLVSIVTTIDMLKAFFGVIECLERSCSS